MLAKGMSINGMIIASPVPARRVQVWHRGAAALNAPSCQPPKGGEGSREGSQFVWRCERYVIDEFFIFLGPQSVSVQSLEHFGDALRRLGRCPAAAPSYISPCCLGEQRREVWRGRGARFQCCQVVQVSDDRRIVLVGTTVTDADPPGEGTQLVRRGLHRIDAGEGRHFGCVALRLCDQRADRSFDRRQGGALERHFDSQVWPQTRCWSEFAR